MKWSLDKVLRAQNGEDVVNGNLRPMIEDKIGFPAENRFSNAVANGNETVGGDEQDELKVLIEQRNMLKKMLRQQEEVSNESSQNA